MCQLRGHNLSRRFFLSWDSYWLSRPVGWLSFLILCCRAAGVVNLLTVQWHENDGTQMWAAFIMHSKFPFLQELLLTAFSQKESRIFSASFLPVHRLLSLFMGVKKDKQILSITGVFCSAINNLAIEIMINYWTYLSYQKKGGKLPHFIKDHIYCEYEYKQRPQLTELKVSNKGQITVCEQYG